MIPDDFLAELKARVDIVAVIGEHVQLKKGGRSWKGLCPFHGEKSPSFHVTPDKGFFYCFGCHKKGDALTFLMEFSGLSFAEAAEQLANRLGLTMPRTEESPEARRRRSERHQLLDINRLACDFYRGRLQHESGSAGRAYLEARGIGAEVSASFALGLAPADWSTLADYLAAQKVDLQLAVQLGLIAPRQRASGYYDKFRERLMCPVIVPGGDVAGFSARLLVNRDDAPKYINSPESPVYKKSRLLFGLAQARESIARKKYALLVEGNFDVITLHQAGLTETVAPLGTAFTAEHVENLRRMAAEVVLCYDGDRAGRAATRVALELLVAADIPVRVVALPDGDDPDSLVRRDGAAGLTDRIQRAPGGVEHYCLEAWAAARGTTEGRTRALDDAAKLLSKVVNPTKRDILCSTLADAMNVPLEVVRRSVMRIAQGGRDSRDSRHGSPGRAIAPQHDQHPNAPNTSGRPDESDRVGSPGASAASHGAVPVSSEEVELVALLVAHATLTQTDAGQAALALLTDPRLRTIAMAAAAGESILDLVATLPEAAATRIVTGTVREAEPETQLATHLAALTHRAGSHSLANLQREMRAAQAQGNSDRVRELTNEIVRQRRG